MHRAGSLGSLKCELNTYKIWIVAFKEIRWKVRISQKEKGPFDSQERDSWTCLKWYEENGC